ncbi:MAG: hypothetical protein H7833_13740 [Magnetococcus sp. DMHC-1]
MKNDAIPFFEGCKWGNFPDYGSRKFGVVGETGFANGFCLLIDIESESWHRAILDSRNRIIYIIIIIYFII